MTRRRPPIVDLPALIQEMVGAHQDLTLLEHEAAQRRTRRNTVARELSSHGMSQRAIAGHLGVHESTVTRLLAYGPFDDDDRSRGSS